MRFGCCHGRQHDGVITTAAAHLNDFRTVQRFLGEKLERTAKSLSPLSVLFQSVAPFVIVDSNGVAGTDRAQHY